MWDPVGKLLTELRDDAAVAAIAGENPHVTVPRVRSPEPGPGDAQAPGSYRAFVVITTLATPRMQSVPVQRARHAVSCYGRTPEEAEALYNACSDAIHHIGPRQNSRGGIYVTHDDTGGDEAKDPDTGQPRYQFVIETLATTQAVA